LLKVGAGLVDPRALARRFDLPDRLRVPAAVLESDHG